MSHIDAPGSAAAIGSSDPSDETDPEAPRGPLPTRPTPPRSWGAVAGLVAGGAAVAVGSLVASLTGGVSPIDAVGTSFIDRTPMWLKDLATDWFGTRSKTALRVGIAVVLAVLAAALGVAGLRHRRAAAVGFIVVGLVGLLTILERPSPSAGSIAAPVVGVIVGITVLHVLLEMLNGRWASTLTPGPSRAPLGWDRRRFLAASGGAAAGSVVIGAAARQIDQRRLDDIAATAPSALPSVPARETVGAPPSGATVLDELDFVTPIDDFYRIDTALSFPRVSTTSWRLRLHGLVEREIVLTYDDLLCRPQVERMITLCCVSNPIGGPYIGNAVWQGVRLADLIDEASPLDDAEQVFSTSVDGWTCGFPLSAALDGREALIAIGMNGEPLPVKNGFPARLVVPGLYGYVSATKWLEDIEITTWDARTGYWIPRGWSRDAPVKTQSRIDVPRRGDTVPAGRRAIAGVAWAQGTGIARVEVRIDDGPWQDAVLGDDVSDDTWRQWRIDWDASPGSHRIQVRATDKSGYTQTDVVTDVAPDGATGWHSRTVTVD